MKYVALIALLFVGTAIARDVYVRPHVRKDGTYVQGHHRSAPDSNPSNNYSTQGNVNPYTGQPGTVNPHQYQPQPYMPATPIQPLPGYGSFPGPNCMIGQTC
jgi:hypothetical protein